MSTSPLDDGKRALLAIATAMAEQSEVNRAEQPGPWQGQFDEMLDGMLTAALKDPRVYAGVSMGAAGNIGACMALMAESPVMTVVALMAQVRLLRERLDAAQADLATAQADLGAERAILDDVIDPEALRLRAVKW